MDKNEITYSIKDISYQDIIDLQSRNGIKTNLSEERFNWLYNNNVNGRATFYCAFDKSLLVGIEVHIPILLTIGNSEMMSAIAVNSLIDDEYRGKGIWKKLLIFSQEGARERGIRIIWGVPNKTSYPILLNKTNWRIVSTNNFEMFFLKTPEKVRLIPSIIHFGFSLLPNILIQDKSDFKFREFKKQGSEFESKGVKVTTGYEYLKWRYFDVPGENFKINSVYLSSTEEHIGYIVYTIIENVLFVVDYCIIEKFTELLPRIVMNFGKLNGCRKINIRLDTKCSYFKYFKRAGSVTRNSYKIFANILDDDAAKIIDNKPWIMNFGDEDIRFIKSFPNSISGNNSLLKKMMHIDP